MRRNINALGLDLDALREFYRKGIVVTVDSPFTSESYIGASDYIAAETMVTNNIYYEEYKGTILDWEHSRKNIMIENNVIENNVGG